MNYKECKKKKIVYKNIYISFSIYIFFVICDSRVSQDRRRIKGYLPCQHYRFVFVCVCLYIFMYICNETIRRQKRPRKIKWDRVYYTFGSVSMIIVIGIITLSYYFMIPHIHNVNTLSISLMIVPARLHVQVTRPCVYICVCILLLWY